MRHPRYMQGFLFVLSLGLCFWFAWYQSLPVESMGQTQWKSAFTGDLPALSVAEARDGQGYPRQGDLQTIARAIHGEARGEPYEGQVAVGAVILNRIRHSSFPNSAHGVIFQPGAFTAVSDGQIWIPLPENASANRAARDALAGWDPTGGCIYYWNPATATSKWIWSRPIVKKIGKHNFAK